MKLLTPRKPLCPEEMGRSWDDVLELGGVGVKSNAGSKASLGTLSGEPHVGASEMNHTWARGPDSKGPCFSVSPKDTGKTLACGSTPGVWGQDVPQGPPRGPRQWQRVGTADRDG